MAYNINHMPKNMEEWEILITTKVRESEAEYHAAVAAARNRAETQYAQLPASANKPTLEQYLAQAVSLVEPPKTRADFEQMYSCYYPQPVIAEPAPTLAELKHTKKNLLDAAFATACQNAVLMSSVGFEIDANETANRNVNGLIVAMEDMGMQTTQFCDAANNFHAVTLDQLKTMQLEIIRYGQELYAKKWQYRAAIAAAQTAAELAAIGIVF